MTKRILTPAEIKELFNYDPETGSLSWRARGMGRVVGKHLTRKDTLGYVTVRVLGTAYLAHRLAWAHFYGTNPTQTIDHINRNKGDNRILNLRQVTQKQNLENITTDRRNKSGVRGVHWSESHRKWRAAIQHDSVAYRLGWFDRMEDAVAARKLAEQKYFTHAPC